MTLTEILLIGMTIYAGFATYKIYTMYDDVAMLQIINMDVGETSTKVLEEMLDEIEELERQAKVSEELLDEYRRRK